MKEYKAIEPSNLEGQPFKTRYLDEEKTETGDEIISIRLNPQERALINELKQILHYNADSRIIKISLIVHRNVLRATYGYDLMDKICDETRRKPLFDSAKELIKP